MSAPTYDKVKEILDREDSLIPVTFTGWDRTVRSPPTFSTQSGKFSIRSCRSLSTSARCARRIVITTTTSGLTGGAVTSYHTGRTGPDDLRYLNTLTYKLHLNLKARAVSCIGVCPHLPFLIRSSMRGYFLFCRLIVY